MNDYLAFPLILYYPFLAFVLLIMALVLVPGERMRRLFLESLLFGFVLSLFFAGTMHILGVFRYAHTGAFTFLGSPVWLNLTWSPAIMLYLHFQPPINKSFLFWSYLLSFSLLSAMLDNVLHGLGLLIYLHWSPAARYVVAAAWFYAASLAHERYFEPAHGSTGDP
ncbi:MAG: hypothetical protein ACM3X6_12435 [Patescibacteria group bacterium]